MYNGWCDQIGGGDSKPVNGGKYNCRHGGCRLNHHGYCGRVGETKEHFALCLVYCRWGGGSLGERVDGYKL